MNTIARVSRYARRAVAKLKAIPALLASVNDRGWRTIFDSDRHLGDWQKDVHIDRGRVNTNWAIWACMTLIASDVAKIRLDLVSIAMGGSGIEKPAYSAAFSPVIRKPNDYQTRQQFIESWGLSKLGHGNAYILKVFDDRGIVIRMHVLDPHLVKPLVAANGAVWYQIGADRLAEVTFGDDPTVTYVPADNIIHDRFNCLFHPLVGLSPIFASGLAAMQGLKIQENSAKFFGNMSRPSGVLTAPGDISDDTADRIKKHWDENFGGDKLGKIAVLGDDLKYQAMTISPMDAQMNEQLKMSAEMICTTFHVPPFKIGAGAIPQGQKVEDLNQIYYSDCLQSHMVAVETLLTEGLGLDTPKETKQYAVRFNLDDLLRMNMSGLVTMLKTAVDASLMAPNEGRRRINLGPVPGGDAPLSQQQNYSLEALAKRDASDDPFKSAAPPAPAPPAKPANDPNVEPAPAKLFEDLRAELLTIGTSVRSLVEDRAEEDRALERASQADATTREFADALMKRFTLAGDE